MFTYTRLSWLQCCILLPCVYDFETSYVSGVGFIKRLQFDADVILISGEPVIYFGSRRAFFAFVSKNVGSAGLPYTF